MIRMILRRLAGAIPNVIGVVIVTFLLTRALPGDPAAYFAGVAATKEAIEQVRVSLGLDKSLAHQFAFYLKDLARGNFGNSLSTGQPVLTEIRQRLPASLELTLCGLLLAVAVAVPLGVLAATRPGSWVDHLCRLLATAGVSLPTSSPACCSPTCSISCSASHPRLWGASTFRFRRRQRSRDCSSWTACSRATWRRSGRA